MGKDTYIKILVTVSVYLHQHFPHYIPQTITLFFYITLSMPVAP